jgi:hypothetical protein
MLYRIDVTIPEYVIPEEALMFVNLSVCALADARDYLQAARRIKRKAAEQGVLGYSTSPSIVRIMVRETARKAREEHRWARKHLMAAKKYGVVWQ